MKVVDNVHVYGLDFAVQGSKFPMSIDTESLNSEITKRTESLASAQTGSGHDQFLTGIIVQFDLTFSNKAWVEAERYHFFDFISSQSTMHRITKMDVKKQCNEFVDHDIISILQKKVEAYNAVPTPENYLRVLYNIPSGFQLTARMTTNYRQLKTIYHQRRTHRLPEWREFCHWIETLPHSEFITGVKP